jgi:hypothetical protein
MRIAWSLAFAILLSARAAEAPAQTYTIKFKSYPDVGKTVSIKDSDKETGSMKFMDASGKLLNEIKPKTKEAVYTQTILERKKGNEPTHKFKRVYEKATEAEEGKTKTFSYQGRTVVFERKDGKYWVGVAGKQPVEAKDLDTLIEKANDEPGRGAERDKAITPAKAVAVGDSWSVDPKVVGGVPKDAELDPKASNAEAKLVRVYMKGKSQFGVIEIKTKLAVKAIGKDFLFSTPAVQEESITLDTAIDGSSTLLTRTYTAKIKGKGVLQQGDQKVTIVMDMAGTGRMERSEEKDDADARKVPAVELVGPGGKWTEFTSKEGRFAASFPGKPDKATKKDKSAVTTTFAATREKGRVAYIVMYSDYERPDPKADPKAVLKAASAPLAKETKMKKEIKLNGVDGVDLVLEKVQGGEKWLLNHRIYYVDGRLYQVMVAYPADVKDKVQVAKFFDSFKLHVKKDTKEPDKDELNP